MTPETGPFRQTSTLREPVHEARTYSVGDTICMADVVLVPTGDQTLLYRNGFGFRAEPQAHHSVLDELGDLKAADWRKQGTRRRNFGSRRFDACHD